jgi:hypothetical protein
MPTTSKIPLTGVASIHEDPFCAPKQSNFSQSIITGGLSSW